MTFPADTKRPCTVNPAAPSEIGAVRTTAITMIILHSAETGETPTAAEGVGTYFHNGSDGRYASAHYTTDENSLVQSVPELNYAWGVMGYNRWAIHIEQAGRAAQSAPQWNDAYSHMMIYGQTIPLIAEIVHRRPLIHLTWLTVPDLIVCIRKHLQPVGITSHMNCTLASKATGMANSGHLDPGPAYPYAAVLTAAAALLK